MIKRIYILILLFSTSIVAISQADSHLGFWETGYWKKVYIKNDFRDGEYFKIRKGDTLVKGFFKDGLPIGVWVISLPDRLYAESDFNGNAEFWLNGHPYCTYVSGKYKNGIPVGTWITYKRNSYIDNDSLRFSNPSNDTAWIEWERTVLVDYLPPRYWVDSIETEYEERRSYIENKIKSSWMSMFEVGYGNYNSFTPHGFAENLKQKYDINTGSAWYWHLGSALGLDNEYFIKYGIYSNGDYNENDNMNSFTTNDSLTVFHNNTLFKLNYGKNLLSGTNIYSPLRFSLSPALGLGFGRMKIIEQYEGNKLTSKNPYTILDFMIDGRVIYSGRSGIISGGIIAGSTYDISSTTWKKDKINGLNNYRQETFYIMYIVGFSIFM